MKRIGSAVRGRTAEARSTRSVASGADDVTGLVRALDGTGRGIRIGVVDSGWDRTVNEPRVIPGINLVDPVDDFRLRRPADDHDWLGHGTAATDLVLQVAPEATVVPIRVFGGRLETSPHVLVTAIDWAISQELRLINLSLGTAREDALVPLYAACERARRAGVIMVAAASNHGNGWSYPAVLEPVLGVAHARVTHRHDFVYRGDEAIECGARATGQLARGLGGRTCVMTGTSLASAIVAGHVARLLEADPDAGLDGVRRLLNQRVERQ